MKKIRNLLLTFIAVSAFSLNLINSASVKAATKEDVIAAAKAAGIPDTYIQNGKNLLETSSYSPEDYDNIIAKIKEYSGNSNDGVKDFLDDASDAVVPPQTQPAVTTEAGSQIQPAGNTAGNPVSAPAPAGNHSPVISGIIDKYSSMTPEERKEYIEGMTAAEKNEIIKNLDKDKQLEIINSLIDAGSEFGMNIAVDDLTDNKLTYSVRDNDGQIVDISSVGIVIGDTGKDYTAFILIAASVIVMSSAGIAVFAAMQKKAFGIQSDNGRDN